MLEALNACHAYYRANPTVHRLLLVWSVEIMLNDYYTGYYGEMVDGTYRWKARD